jgi:fimbrial isopeptide formation D2 family protein/LPXTG-motif cell wall-anchored protein
MTAFAAGENQTIAYTGTDGDGATITIKNPAKGQTYNIYKLFDATVSADGNKISYQGTVPTSLSAFFTADDKGNISPTDAIAVKDDAGKITGTKMTDELKAALETWAAGQTATAATPSTGSTGTDDLLFTGLPYGYYVMTTSHKDSEEGKAVISVDSTKPNADIYDKNVTKVEAKEKKVFDKNGTEISSVTIGDTVTYVAKFDTSNYVGEGADSLQVTKYVIKDTLPEFITDVNITSVTVGGTALTPTPRFDANKQIAIPWVDANNTSLYAQGAEIVVTYTAKVTSTININTVNKNTISIQPYTGSGDGTPWTETFTTSNEITTYGAAINKVDENNEPLAGAQFTIKGLTVEGSNGVYTVVSYDPASTTESDPLATDENGKLYIVGLAENVSLTVTEYKAPDGYNKLTDTKTLTTQDLKKAIFTTTTTINYDKDGNKVSEAVTGGSAVEVTRNLSDLDAGALQIQNLKGTELPSTGGIGTTMFYVVGGVLVAAAVVILVSKKRAGLD